jgi:hypothetical protein
VLGCCVKMPLVTLFFQFFLYGAQYGNTFEINNWKPSPVYPPFPSVLYEVLKFSSSAKYNNSYATKFTEPDYRRLMPHRKRERKPCLGGVASRLPWE